MGQRCPSCGMESPPEAAWCDFCKEPFRKAKPAPAPAPTAAPLSEDDLLKRLPAEFLRHDDGLALPKLPPWFKWFAWAFLASWLISGMILVGILYGRKKSAEPLPSTPAPGSYDSGPILVPTR